MTKKLKHTLIVTLSALFLALTGFALVSSSQSKVNADDDIPVIPTEQKTKVYEAILGKEYSVCVDSTKPIADVLAGYVSVFECEEGKVFSGYWSTSDSEIKPYAIKNETFLDLVEVMGLKGNEMSMDIWYSLNFYPIFIDSSAEISVTFDIRLENIETNFFSFTCTGKWDEEIYSDLLTKLDTFGYLYRFAKKAETIDSLSIVLRDFVGKTYFEVANAGPNSSSEFVGVCQSIDWISIYFKRDGKIITTRTIVRGETLSGADLKGDCAREGYNLLGYSLTENGEIVYSADEDITPDDSMTLYAVYKKIETPSGTVTPDNTDTDKSDDSTGIGDKISDVADNVSNWLKDNTGVVFSSGSLIIIAIVLAVVMLSKRK